VDSLLGRFHPEPAYPRSVRVSRVVTGVIAVVCLLGIFAHTVPSYRSPSSAWSSSGSCTWSSTAASFRAILAGHAYRHDPLCRRPHHTRREAGVSVIYAVIPPPLSRSPERRASV